jgi:NADH-quinone oxidoreductase subunit G
VLGSLLGLSGFEYDDAEAIRIDAIGNDPAAMARRLSNRSLVAVAPPAKAGNGTLERIADVPIYAADPLVRRAVSLQKTADARKPLLRLNAATAAMLHVTGGGAVRVRQGNGEAMLNAAIDEGVPDRCVRIAAAHAATATLGPMFGAIAVDPL